MQSTNESRKSARKPKISQMSARDYAVFLLSMKLQSEGQLRLKMARKKYSESDVDDAISYLKELHYLNDKQYAQIFFENLVKYKNFGYFGIKKKLIERRLPKKLIEKIMQNFSAANELVIAKRILQKYSAKSAEQKAKMLQSKGFRSEVIYRATKKDVEVESRNLE